METEGGYVPPEAAEFTAKKVTGGNEAPASAESVELSDDNSRAMKIPVESGPDAVQTTEPEVLPIPSGPLKQQLQEMQLPDKVQLALNARVNKENGLQEIPSRITPELLMSFPGKGEGPVTLALDMLDRYGVRVKRPEPNDPINSIGLDHVRNDRLRKQGIGTFGQLLAVWGNPQQRNSLDQSDVAIIAHRLKRLGLGGNASA
jgi:hypothetical protein